MRPSIVTALVSRTMRSGSPRRAVCASSRTAATAMIAQVIGQDWRANRIRALDEDLSRLVACPGNSDTLLLLPWFRRRLYASLATVRAVHLRRRHRFEQRLFPERTARRRRMAQLLRRNRGNEVLAAHPDR